ncbi:MAG: hypothetical protein EOM87_03690, partial [Clostridia bacterium]|nr:hypothetical protein [Clostridia bacterium]
MYNKNMDSNIDFLRKFVNNHILRMLSQDTFSFVEISDSILNKTNKSYFFKTQALASCIKQLIDEGSIVAVNGNSVIDNTFSITENGLKIIKSSVTSWDLSKEMLDRIFTDPYNLYSLN